MHSTDRNKPVSPRARLLVLEAAGNLWGSERALADLLGAMDDTQWKVGVCCPPAMPFESLLDKSRIQIFPTFVGNLHLKTKLSRIWALIGLIRAIRSFSPHLIYVNQAGVTKIALAAARPFGLPVVTHTRLKEDVEYVETLLHRDPLKRVICISKFIRDAFSDRIDPDRTLTLYDGYRPACDWHAPQPVPPRSRFVCPSRLGYTKGQDVLVKAFLQFSKATAEGHLTLVGGTGPQDDFEVELQREVAQDEHRDQIRFLGFVDNIWPILGEADFLVCPSRYEPLGRVIFEAWDADLVPLAWKGSGGPAETISASRGGLLYDHQNPECLAETLRFANSMSSEERAGYVQRGRAWLISNCKPQIYAQHMSHCFHQAIDGRAA